MDGTPARMYKHKQSTMEINLRFSPSIPSLHRLILGRGESLFSKRPVAHWFSCVWKVSLYFQSLNVTLMSLSHFSTPSCTSRNLYILLIKMLRSWYGFYSRYPSISCLESWFSWSWTRFINMEIFQLSLSSISSTKIQNFPYFLICVNHFPPSKRPCFCVNLFGAL